MCISTAAIAGIGTTISNAKSIVPKSNFFILLPPILIEKMAIDIHEAFFLCLKVTVDIQPSIPSIFTNSTSDLVTFYQV